MSDKSEATKLYEKLLRQIEQEMALEEKVEDQEDLRICSLNREGFYKTSRDSSKGEWSSIVEEKPNSPQIEEILQEIAKLGALKAYAKMMNTLQTEWLAPMLSEDFRYNSQWVFEEMRGKQKYLDYMRGKFRTITESGSRPHAEIGELQEYPFGYCVILAQNDVDNLIATVLVGVEGGLITRLDMCAVPDPHATKRTGEYPGRE